MARALGSGLRRNDGSLLADRGRSIAVPRPVHVIPAQAGIQFARIPPHSEGAANRNAQFFYTFPVFSLAHPRILYKNTVYPYN